MSPRATLIGDQWAKRTMVFGSKRLEFTAGVPRDVSVAVALALQRTRRNIFKIDGMPQIIRANHPPITGMTPLVTAREIEETSQIPRQRKLNECLS